MQFLIRTTVSVFSLLLVAKILPGIEITDLTTAVWAALLLGVLNSLVRPVFIFLTLPLTLMTFGLFILVINASLLYMTTLVLSGFYVADFGSVIVASILVSVVSAVTTRFIA